MAQSTTTQRGTYYISITGLKLISPFHFPKFAFYNAPTMKQANEAKGNIMAEGSYKNGIFHTLTVWEDRKAMTKFMVSGAHAKAIKMWKDVADQESSKVYGYESKEIPDWKKALEIWTANAKSPYRISNKTKERLVSNTSIHITKFLLLFLVPVLFFGTSFLSIHAFDLYGQKAANH
mmetsp:Transcript_5275/g.6906  ORF Transcript_5275/g.6906 Transcript_5275/m.6906 type:complete len:177 (+) Transcript_5275:147-677(+)